MIAETIPPVSPDRSVVMTSFRLDFQRTTSAQMPVAHSAFVSYGVLSQEPEMALSCRLTGLEGTPRYPLDGLGSWCSAIELHPQGEGKIA